MCNVIGCYPQIICARVFVSLRNTRQIFVTLSLKYIDTSAVFKAIKTNLKLYCYCKLGEELVWNKMAQLFNILYVILLPALVSAECLTNPNQNQVQIWCNVADSSEIATFFESFDSNITISNLTISGTIQKLSGQNIFGRNTTINWLKIWSSSLIEIDFDILNADNLKELNTFEVNFDSDGEKIESQLSPQTIFKLINNMSTLTNAYVNILPNASLEPGLCRNQNLNLLVLSSIRNIGVIYLESFYDCVQLQRVTVKNVPINKIIHEQDISSSSSNYSLQIIEFVNCSLNSESFSITKPTIRTHYFILSKF